MVLGCVMIAKSRQNLIFFTYFPDVSGLLATWLMQDQYGRLCVCLSGQFRLQLFEMRRDEPGGNIHLKK